ncbi:MAG: hypothetical protein ACI8Y7_000507 [Candidatus Woesearchaeota archaeon]|jgi:hypothetical protein
MAIGKKGFFFSIIALMIVSVVFVSFQTTQYAADSPQQELQKVQTQSLNSFRENLIEEYLPSMVEVSLYQSLQLILDDVNQTQKSLREDLLQTILYEAMMNGTFTYLEQTKLVAQPVIPTINQIQAAAGDILGVQVSIEPKKEKFEVYQLDPFTLGVDAVFLVSVSSATSQETKWENTLITIQTNISLIEWEEAAGFVDPLYLIHFNNATPVPTFRKNPKNKDERTIENLLFLIDNQMYIEDNGSPSFLMRLAGNNSPSRFGVQTLINPDRVTTMKSRHNAPFVGHLFAENSWDCSQANPACDLTVDPNSVACREGLLFQLKSFVDNDTFTDLRLTQADINKYTGGNGVPIDRGFVCLAGPPTNVLANTGSCGGKVSLSWDAVLGEASNYLVSRSQQENTSYVTVAEILVPTTTHNDINLYTGKTYFYKVGFENDQGGVVNESAEGFSGFSSPVQVVASNHCVPATPPDPLVANAARCGGVISFSWPHLTEVLDDASGEYLVDHISFTPGEVVTQTDIISGLVNITTLTGLTPGQTHNFRVRARNSAGTSGSSSLLTIDASDDCLPRQIPLNFKSVTASCGGQVALEWDAVDNLTDGSDGYHVYNNFTTVFLQVGAVISPTVNFTTTGLQENHDYTYHVAAFNGGGDGNSTTNTTRLSTFLCPTAVANLQTLVAPCGGIIELDWDAAGIENTGDTYKIQRDAGAGFVEIAQIDSVHTNFTDVALIAGASADYLITIISPVDESAGNSVSAVSSNTC